MKQKNDKKFVMLLNIIVLFICALYINPMFVEAADFSSGDWQYTVSSGEATVTAYMGDSLEIIVPSELNGYPVTGVGSGIFCDSNITDVTIPESIEYIGSRAFANCKYLSNIYFNAKDCEVYYHRAEMDDSHVFINAGKFSDSLTVTFGEKVEKIPTCLFEASGDTYARVTSVVISDSIKKIGDWAFHNCYDLSSVSWGAGITDIGQGAFLECTSLKSVIVPEKVGNIGASAFANCKNLTTINFNAKNCEVYYHRAMMDDMHVFVNAGKFSDSLTVTFGEAVERIPASLFEASEKNYAHITSVSIPKGTKEIGEWAFNTCFDLRKITILSDSIVFHKDYNDAFANCSSELIFECFVDSTTDAYAKNRGFQIKYLEPENGWYELEGFRYWYENNVRQGTYEDSKGVLGDGTIRGREIYDSKSDGWYWLDAVYGGAKAINKEVWMPYIYQNEAEWDEAEIAANASASGDMAEQVIKEIHNKNGKWVRYNSEGKMYKGWYTVEGEDEKLYPNQVGNTYYYDLKTGLMAKGTVEIDGQDYYFDEVTGVLQK